MKLPFLLLGFLALAATGDNPAPLTFTIQKRIAAAGTDNYNIVKEKQEWEPSETAIIVCDMWDQHWCKGATARVGELAPRMNEVLSAARRKGILIVFAPSDCMDYYKDYPQRHAAEKYSSPVDQYVEGRDPLPTEKNAKWPVDQSNEGCNDTPRCEVRKAWKSQTNLLTIDKKDVISDSGPEMQRLFADKGVKRIVLMGVHTNMCVIMRPFGMRSMISNGKEVFLMRDMTDLMYDARAYPYVNHFEGLGLMIEYIEKYIAPTVTSTDLTGWPAFKFKDDPRQN